MTMKNLIIKVDATMNDDLDNQNNSSLADDLNIKSVVPEIYKDIISPAAKEVGKGLVTVGKAVNIALAPIAGLVWGYDKIEKYVKTAVEKRLKNKNPDDIQSPPPNIAGPLLESLRFSGYQEDLRELYANLLASSMDKNIASNAHPSFVEIIKQISPDEAKILNVLPRVTRYPQICTAIQKNDKFHPQIRSNLSYKDLRREFTDVCRLAKIEHNELVNSYLDNLRRLLLLEFEQAVGQIGLEIDFNENLVVKNDITEYLSVTKLGQQFIKACVIPKY